MHLNGDYFELTGDVKVLLHRVVATAASSRLDWRRLEHRSTEMHDANGRFVDLPLAVEPSCSNPCVRALRVP